MPELNGGETDYLSPDAPSGVFACLRKGPGLAVPLVNLNGVRTAGDVRLHENGTWRRLSGAIYLKAEGEKPYDQISDVEPIAALSREADGTLKLSFDGVLRNIRRTGKMPHGTSYHTSYTIGRTARVVVETSF